MTRIFQLYVLVLAKKEWMGPEGSAPGPWVGQRGRPGLQTWSEDRGLTTKTITFPGVLVRKYCRWGGNVVNISNVQYRYCCGCRYQCWKLSTLSAANRGRKVAWNACESWVRSVAGIAERVEAAALRLLSQYMW